MFLIGIGAFDHRVARRQNPRQSTSEPFKVRSASVLWERLCSPLEGEGRGLTTRQTDAHHLAGADRRPEGAEVVRRHVRLRFEIAALAQWKIELVTSDRDEDRLAALGLDTADPEADRRRDLAATDVELRAAR